MNRVQGRTVLVTGAGGGLGAAAVRLLAAEGARVAVSDIDSVAGEGVAAEVRDAGGTALFHPLDVRDEAAWSRVVGEIGEAWGGVDVLVNNAARYLIRPLAETGVDTWDSVFAINVTGAFLGMRECAPAMAARGGGAIVNVSSLAGMRGASGHTLYGATKGALRQMTKDVAAEYCRAGVRVNSVHPSYVRTTMADHAADTFGVARDELGTLASPLGRLAEPHEVAEVLVLLASDGGAYLNGAELVIDGGASALLSTS